MVNVNVGCGEFYAKGWVNVDEHTPHPVDIRVNALDLASKIEEQSVRRIYCGHVLEHVTRDDAVKILGVLRTLLKPGGKIMVVGPDIDIARASGDRQLIHDVEYGAARWDGDAHLWTMNGEDMVDLLVECGFDSVENKQIQNVSPHLWPVTAYVPWQFAVQASVQ